jgi:hypothetical protein
MSTEPARDPAHDAVTDLAEGYARMLERIRARLAEAEARAPLPLYMAIEEAREQAVALGELTQAEAREVAEWLQRDLMHLREVMQRAGRGVRNWLGLDLALLEQGLLDTLADPTRVDWLRLQEEFEMLRRESGAATTPEQQPAKTGQAQKP